MLNPSNGDPGQVVVNYVEEYLDLVESLPCDLQRSVSLMKEIDAKYQGKGSSCYRLLVSKRIFLCICVIYDNMSNLYFFLLILSFADVLKELDDAYERYRRESDTLQRRKLQLAIQRALIRSQELGDEKIQIAGQMVGTEVVADGKVTRKQAPN